MYSGWAYMADTPASTSRARPFPPHAEAEKGPYAATCFEEDVSISERERADRMSMNYHVVDRCLIY